MRKLRVCFITEDFYPSFIGGQGIYGLNLVSEFSRHGVDITVLAERRSGRETFWSGKNINLILVPFVFGNQILLAIIEYLYFIFNPIDISFDIVHANQLSGLLFVLFKPKNVGMVLLSVHNTYFDMYQATDSKIKKFFYKPLIWLERMVYQRADALLFNSPDEKKQLMKYCQIRNKKTAVVYLGVQKISYSEKEKNQRREYLRKKLKLKKDGKIILYVGRLVRKKKIDSLLKALDILGKDSTEIVGIIIGQGKDRERLERIAPKNVFFLGFIDDLRPYFLGSDLFVTVSVAEGGMLLTAIEAANFGLPLILSPSAAGFPIVKIGINGFIVEPDDYRQLAVKIKSVLKNSQQMGKESRVIAKNFTWDQCAKETLKFYQQLV